MVRKIYFTGKSILLRVCCLSNGALFLYSQHGSDDLFGGEGIKL